MPVHEVWAWLGRAGALARRAEQVQLGPWSYVRSRGGPM